jgi:acyl carrier protein
MRKMQKNGEQMIDDASHAIELVRPIWAEVFDMPTVQDHSTFVELGGQSLAAVRILTRVEEKFGITLEIDTLFGNPSLAEFSKLVASYRMTTST